MIIMVMLQQTSYTYSLAGPDPHTSVGLAPRDYHNDSYLASSRDSSEVCKWKGMTEAKGLCKMVVSSPDPPRAPVGKIEEK